MKLSQQELNRIIRHSMTLDEWLKLDFSSEPLLDQDNPTVDKRLNTWCEIVAEGDWEKFEQRLAWDELDLFKAKKVVSSVNTIEDIPHPPWTEILNECLENASTINLQDLIKYSYSCQLLDPKIPLLFEEVFLPFINVATKKLKYKAGSSYELLSGQAHASLERSLLRTLSWVCKDTLGLEFNIFNLTKQSSLDRIANTYNTTSSRNNYQEFITNLLEIGLNKLFFEYPVLARLVSTLIEMWVNANKEFLFRLEVDLPHIEEVFQAKSDLGQVIDLKCEISDRHQGGRSVMIIKFNSGLKIVYKPRNIGIETAYIKLLAWFNEQGISLPFRLYKILNKSDYGWTEFIETSNPTDNNQYKLYYQRLGMLICLTYILDSTDLHFENIIPCGEYPVLIDLETLMHPRVRELENFAKSNSTEYIAYQKITNSVIRSGLLPRWQFNSDGEVYDASGLGGHYQHYIPSKNKRWENINTDQMQLGLTKREVKTDNMKLKLENYHEDIITGFRLMYGFIVKHRSSLFTSDSPLVDLFEQPIRFVFRNTRTYSLLLQKTLNPQTLSNGIERSVQLDILSKQLIISEAKPYFMPVLKMEKLALENVEIPLFYAKPNSDNISIGSNEEIKKFFLEPSSNRVIQRIKELNDSDLNQQIYFIKYSLYSRINKDLHYFSQSNHLNLDVVPEKIVKATTEKLVNQALNLALQLDQQSIRGSQGIITWICSRYIPNKQCFHFQDIGNDLYGGDSGVALFFASLAKITLQEKFRQLAINILRSFSHKLTKLRLAGTFNNEINLGGANGVGSIIYTFARIYEFLGEEFILERANQFASLITPDMIAADRRFDIIDGTAGTILGLLALHKVLPDPSILELATICGNHLLNNRIVSRSGFRTWETLNKRLFTGFSHGCSGITYALSKLYQVTDNTEFREGAKEGIAYERSVFDPKIGNWPDFRGASAYQNPSFVCSWCHGASGIGLARLGTLDILDSVEIRQDIEVAINTTKQQKLKDTDSLCCGNWGRVDFLLTAAQKLSRSDLLEDAREIASQVITRAEQKGHFGYSSILDFHPGFFQGASGIGYQLLRLAYPDQLPSVLLWE